MAKRLINRHQIREEKIARCRSWIFAEMKAGRFPKPVVEGAGSGGHLWDESDIDRWLEEFVAKCKACAASGEATGKKRVGKAAAARHGVTVHAA